MNSLEKESEIKRLFESLRRSEEGFAPPFEAVLAARKASRRPSATRYRFAAAMLVLLISLAPVLWHLGRERSGLDEAVDLGIYEGSFPTDFLLTMSEDTLVAEIPELGTPSRTGERRDERIQ